jgi:hypothetical protein
MYKLNRLWNIKMTATAFSAREIPEDSLDFNSHLPDDYMITAVFDSSLKYKLVEDYGERCFTENGDGRLLFKRGFTKSDNVVSWLLSFGDKAEVLQPEDIRAAVREAAEKNNK